LVVTNQGQTTANGVVPSTMQRTGTGSALLQSGPTPASANLTGGLFTNVEAASEAARRSSFRRGC
jgi:hypothetical protein